MRLSPLWSKTAPPILISTDGCHVSVGRNPQTQIKDTKCSRVQTKLWYDRVENQFCMRRLGALPSYMNRMLIGKGDVTIVTDGDVIELLQNKYRYRASVLAEIRHERGDMDNEAVGDATDLEDEHENEIRQKLALFKTFAMANGLSDDDPSRDLTNSCAAMTDDDGNVSLVDRKPRITEPIKALRTGWQITDNLLVYTTPDLEHRSRIAGFDMDGTIICTKSGRVFARDEDDWQLLYPQVPDTLRRLHNDGYKLVIFTNQKGLSNNKVDPAGFKRKVEAIISRLSVPVQVFVSPGNTLFRKPLPGMWEYLESQENGGIYVDRGRSIFVGDAAGREEYMGRKKDFSCADRLFAFNLKVSFKTPEELFLEKKIAIPYHLPSFNPQAAVDVPPANVLNPPSASLTSGSTEMIMLVGYPGSGKSFFTSKYLIPKGYVAINRDTLGNPSKCITAADSALRSNRCVVIDNTNSDRKSRSIYIDIARKHHIPCRCFQLAVNFEMAVHMNRYRLLSGPDREHVSVNEMVLNTYRKRFEQPVLAEGFAEIVQVNFIPDFEDDESRRLFSMYLVER